MDYNEYVFKEYAIEIIRKRRRKGIRYEDIAGALRVFFGLSPLHLVAGKEITDEEIDDLYREATTKERILRFMGADDFEIWRENY